MPRVHIVKKARKADRVAGIKKGDTYYWWKFRYGGIHKSLTQPKRSQLTQSEFYAEMFDAEDGLAAVIDGELTKSDLTSALNDIAETVRAQGEECQERYSNMEQAFPNGCPTMELLQSRADKCEEIAGELEDIASRVEDVPDEDADEAVCECGDDRAAHAELEGDHTGACDNCDCLGFVYDNSVLDEFTSEVEAVDWSVE